MTLGYEQFPTTRPQILECIMIVANDIQLSWLVIGNLQDSAFQNKAV